MSTLTPNMGLTEPTVGGDYNVWGSELNASLTAIDQHNHTTGQGVQIPTAGININADLSLNSFNATSARSVRFVSQPSVLTNATDIACVYAVNGDLYYNDNSGNRIRITQSGSVAGSSGTITGLPSGSASAAYVAISQTFVFQSSANTAANLDARSIVLRNSTASSNGLTLSPPAAMASNISLVLPAIPAATSILQIDPSGNITAQSLGANTILGNNTAASAPAVALSVAQVNAMLPVFTSSLNGVVPASGGGTTDFLRADGVFAPPSIDQTWNRASGVAQTFVMVAPASLGQYASFIKNGATTATYGLSSNSSPTITPNSSNGFQLYNGRAFGTASTINQPWAYQVFVGLNMEVMVKFYASSGFTNVLDCTPGVWNSTTTIGITSQYDPMTGIVSIFYPWNSQYTSPPLVGWQNDGLIGGSNVGQPLTNNNIYFDILYR